MLKWLKKKPKGPTFSLSKVGRAFPFTTLSVSIQLVPLRVRFG